MDAIGKPYSVGLTIRVTAAEAFDGFPGTTISDRMLAAVEEIDRLHAADEAVAADRDEARALLRRFTDLFRDKDGDVIARRGASPCDDLLIETMEALNRA